MTDEQLDTIIDAQWGKGCMPNQYKAHRAFARAVLAAAPSAPVGERPHPPLPSLPTRQVAKGYGSFGGLPSEEKITVQADGYTADQLRAYVDATRAASSAPVIQEVLAERSDDWIPVTERLPEGSGEVLCWVPFDRGGGMPVLYHYWHVDDEGPGGKCWADDGARLTSYLPSHWKPIERPARRAADTERQRSNENESSSAAIGAASQGGEQT